MEKTKEEILSEIIITREELIDREIDQRIKGYRNLEKENLDLKKIINSLKSITDSNLSIITDVFRAETILKDNSFTEKQKEVFVSIYWEIHKRLTQQ